MEEYWEIKEAPVDSTTFFRLLPKYFRDATTLFVEGTSIETDVLDCYQSHSEQGEYLPGNQTIWPKSKCLRCVFTIGMMEDLANLSLKHAEPELIDHLYLYREKKVILEWPDAFGASMFLPSNTPEETVAAFAKDLGLKYGKEKFS